jgi:hypothetical protein
LEQEFLTLDEQEQNVRSVTEKMEAGLFLRFAAVQNE